MKGPYDSFNLNLLTPDPIKHIRFGAIMGDINDKDKPYQEIPDLSILYPRLEFYLEDYNSNTKRPMSLVLFDFAVDHILKISRIIRMQQSHALLVGLGGSGR
jgi:dynein heavy chain, axonemal